MQSVRTFLLLAALAASPAAASQANPIGKVLQLIGDLQTKVIKEGEEAQKVYTEFAEWCEDSSKNLAFEIKTGKAEAKDLKAQIDEEVAMQNSLEAEIEKLSSELKVDEADLKAATEIREKEAEAFAATEKELMEITDTLQRAIGILEKEAKKGAASMLQVKGAQNLAQALAVMVDAAMLSTSDATRLTSLMQNSDSDSDAGAPAAANYENHSGGILDVLGDMLEKAESQLEEARGKETKDLNTFSVLKLSIEDEIKFGKKEMSEAQASKSASGEKEAAAQGDLDMTTKTLNEDIKAQSELHHNCMTKAEEFEAETKSRGEELAALAKAKEVIVEATGGAEAQSYGLAQTSLLQVSSETSSMNIRAVRLIRELAARQHSTALAQLAGRMSMMSRGPFDKVMDLVRDMIAKLEKEAEEDATQKAFCDKELAETNQKKDDKNTEIEKLSTKIDKMSSRSAQLKEEIAALEQALSKLSTEQAEMDKLRQEEKAVYDKAKAELEQGIEGVKTALKVLNEYYASEDKAHATDDGASSGIIGLLEVCESDFSKNLAEATSVEEQAVATYEEETKENEIEKTTKEQDVKYKTKESKELDKATAEASNDRDGVKAELAAVMEYLKKIEEKCIAKAETHAERAARFKSEIAGLKEALSVLNEEAALVQKGTSHRMLRGIKPHA